MFFNKAGTVIAWLLIILGGYRIIGGLVVASQIDGKEAMIAASRRYLGTANSGTAIDSGLMIFVAGIVVGLLVKIAKIRTGS